MSAWRQTMRSIVVFGWRGNRPIINHHGPNYAFKMAPP
jgi:hypothetical protein